MNKKLRTALTLGVLALSANVFAADVSVELIQSACNYPTQAVRALQAGDNASAAEYIKHFKQQAQEITSSNRNITIERARELAKKATLSLEEGNVKGALVAMITTYDLMKKLPECAR